MVDPRHGHLIQFMKRIQYDKNSSSKYFQNGYLPTRSFPHPHPNEMPMGAPVVQRLSPEQIGDSIVTLRIEDPDKLVTQDP